MKTVLTGVLVLFLGFWLVKAPESFAAFAQDGAGWAWAMTTTLFQSAIDFLGALFK
jgi:hypothetical protein